MGIRADMTPQVARIDAQRLNQQGVTRLCYASSVLRTLPDSTSQTRQPLQLGAELFGHAGQESDLEIQRLMVEALWLAGVHELMVDLSHVAIFRAIVTRAGLPESLESRLFAALQAKDAGELQGLAADTEKNTRDALLALPELNGGIEVVQQAQDRLPQYAEIKLALQDLRRAHEQLGALGVAANFDLADLRGYHYHSGVVFAAYTPAYPGALAMGGRYDQIGQVFGRARPATGFSLDMRMLVSCLPHGELDAAILVPYVEGDGILQETIEKLRGQGEIVIVDLPGHQQHRQELNCDRRLEKIAGAWVLVPNA
jgi:ATP phosphoribosyltransferase regulatory subunit